MNEIGATLSASSTKLKWEIRALHLSGLQHMNVQTNRWQFAAPHRHVTCGGTGTGTAPHEDDSPWEQGPLQPAPANESQVPATQLHLSCRGFPSEQVTKVSGEYRSFVLQTTQVIYSGACWEREMTRTSARLACEAEGSSQGTQPLNTKPEHPG